MALAGVVASLCGSVAKARPAPRSQEGVAPYCVLIAGPRGTSLPQICRFFGYQQCLQAAADLRGNCVQNIDYRGPAPDTTGAAWARGTR
jgi:hypothetical protein